MSAARQPRRERDGYHAFGLIGTALSKKISVFRSSSLKVVPISPNASYCRFVRPSVHRTPGVRAYPVPLVPGRARGRAPGGPRLRQQLLHPRRPPAGRLRRGPSVIASLHSLLNGESLQLQEMSVTNNSAPSYISTQASIVYNLGGRRDVRQIALLSDWWLKRPDKGAIGRGRSPSSCGRPALHSARRIATEI